MSLLDVNRLTIRYADAERPVVDDLSFSLSPGDSLGIVGDSGSGKTQTALAIMGLLPGNAMTAGSIRFAGQEVIGASEEVLNRFRARRFAMVFQDPKAALNPYLRIGDQLRRVLLEHGLCDPEEAREKTLAMLGKVGLADPERQYAAYPHQLSGGMRQRAMLGAALIGEPDLLIADEPTTALDVTVQAQILRLIRELKAELNTALLLITHDLGVIAGNCVRTLVMARGQLLEEGPTREVFHAPTHERTAGLLAASSRLDEIAAPAPPSGDGSELLDIDRVSVSFREGRGSDTLTAVQAMSLGVARRETIAVVGESGSGKTSLARAVLGLIAPDSGTVSLLGANLAAEVQARTDDARRALQMVFQDPLASLNPAMTVADIVAEPLTVHRPEKNASERADDVGRMLQRVGLTDDLTRRLPHELSGGQAQRVAIARALIMQPAVLICDEAVAALDGSIRNDILKLLQTEQERSGLALIFITHDLSVVRQISHRVLVMYLGRVCEIASNDALFRRPRHPYSKAMIDAVPVPDPDARLDETPLAGEAGSILQRPTGCAFHPRCPHAVARCGEELPRLCRDAAGSVACHRAGELNLSY